MKKLSVEKRAIINIVNAKELFIPNNFNWEYFINECNRLKILPYAYNKIQDQLPKKTVFIVL